jgi:hypothetical protein
VPEYVALALWLFFDLVEAAVHTGRSAEAHARIRLA